MHLLILCFCYDRAIKKSKGGLFMKRFTALILVMLSCLSITACASDPTHITNAQSSIFHSITVTNTDRSIIVKADAYLNVTTADFLILDLADEQTVTISYTLTRTSGEASMICLTPDEETIPLANSEEATYGEQTLTLKPGTNTFYLTGSDSTFNLSFSITDIAVSGVTTINGEPPKL